MPMVPAMQTLVLAGLVRSVAATAGSVFQGVGKPQIETKGHILRLSVLAISIYPLTVEWGIVGASVSVFLSILVSTIGFSCMALRITKCGIKEFSKAVVLPLINAVIMIWLIYLFKIKAGAVGILEFTLLAAIGGVSYLVVAFLLDRFSNYGMHSLIRESLTALRGN